MTKQSGLIGGLLVLVAAIVILSMAYLGSPATVRKRNQDRERVSDLQNVATMIAAFADREDHLPEDLDALRAENRWIELPTDPETGETYDYQRLSRERFQVCAIFATEHRGPTQWAHGVGRQCFERVVELEE